MTKAPNTAPARVAHGGGGTDGLRFRTAGPDDLRTCWEIWRESINDYMVRLNQPPIPVEADSIIRLHDHFRSTDPERFVLATRKAERGGGERVVGFTSSIRRGDLWFLSMLFVRAQDQGAGVGRALLAQVLPTDDAILATATDAVQPISNALYASLGMIPRMPLFGAIGRPVRDGGFEPLPRGIVAQPLRAGAYDRDTGVAGVLDAIDREILGFVRPQDHRFLGVEGRHGFLYRGPDGTAVGYGFASEAGRVGPIAARDEALLGPILGHVLTAIEPRGASALWLPGAAGGALAQVLRAGLRLEGFPVLLCWTRPFADFSRYLPVSPALP